MCWRAEIGFSGHLLFFAILLMMCHRKKNRVTVLCFRKQTKQKSLGPYYEPYAARDICDNYQKRRKRKNRDRIIINHNYCIVHKHLFFNVLTSFFPSFPWIQMLRFKPNATKQKYRCQPKYRPSWSSIPSVKRWAIKGNCLVHGKLKCPDGSSVHLYLLCLRKLGNRSFTRPFSTFFSDTLQRMRFFSGKWSDGSNDLIDSWWGN